MIRKGWLLAAAGRLFTRKPRLPSRRLGLEVLERRVLTTYRAHLTRAGVASPVRQCLMAILHEMEEEEDGEHAGWIDEVLRTHPHAEVEIANRRWHAIDADVAGEIERIVAARFPEPQS